MIKLENVSKIYKGDASSTKKRRLIAALSTWLARTSAA